MFAWQSRKFLTNGFQSDEGECEEDEEEEEEKEGGDEGGGNFPKKSFDKSSKFNSEIQRQNIGDHGDLVLNGYCGQSSSNKAKGQRTTMKCRNSKCRYEVPIEEGRKNFKTCHHCYTYYCSKKCRSEHRPRHKQNCLQSRLNSVCKRVLRTIHDESPLTDEFSKKAFTGLLKGGKGCLILVFESCQEAEEFIVNPKIKDNLSYHSLTELRRISEMHDDDTGYIAKLLKTVADYNPDMKFVLDVEIDGGMEQRHPLPRNKTTIMREYAKFRLSDSYKLIPQKNGPFRPLIFTEVPSEESTELNKRRVFFAHVQSKLFERGIRLEKDYPDIYVRLCDYVERNEHFSPVCIYPIDNRTGKEFMCLIMPDSEADKLDKDEFLHIKQ